jgi:hypothetical protein
LSAERQRKESASDLKRVRVVDLEEVRVERMVPGIVEELQAHGGALADVNALDSVERWRRAARRAGRLLGWRIRTGVSHGRAWAACEDWPVSSPGNASRTDRDEPASILFVESPRWPVLPGGRPSDSP